MSVLSLLLLLLLFLLFSLPTLHPAHAVQYMDDVQVYADADCTQLLFATRRLAQRTCDGAHMVSCVGGGLNHALQVAVFANTSRSCPASRLVQMMTSTTLFSSRDCVEMQVVNYPDGTASRAWAQAYCHYAEDYWSPGVGIAAAVASWVLSSLCGWPMFCCLTCLTCSGRRNPAPMSGVLASASMSTRSSSASASASAASPPATYKPGAAMLQMPLMQDYD